MNPDHEQYIGKSPDKQVRELVEAVEEYWDADECYEGALDSRDLDACDYALDARKTAEKKMREITAKLKEPADA